MQGVHHDAQKSSTSGFFPRNEITGRATRVALSLDPGNHYLPRGDRWGAALR